MPSTTAREMEMLARMAYEAYREVHVLGQQKGLEARAMPKPWNDLGALEQEAWRAAVRARERALK